jgi:hypothetical protein
MAANPTLRLTVRDNFEVAPTVSSLILTLSNIPCKPYCRLRRMNPKIEILVGTMSWALVVGLIAAIIGQALR